MGPCFSSSRAASSSLSIVRNVKLNPDGSLEVWLAAKEYSHIYNIDYHDMFSPVAKMASIQIIISLVATHH